VSDHPLVQLLGRHGLNDLVGIKITPLQLLTLGFGLLRFSGFAKVSGSFVCAFKFLRAMPGNSAKLSLGRSGSSLMASIDDILEFWFGSADTVGKARQVWFIKNSEFDQTIRIRFQDDYQQAAAGKLEHWQQTAPGCVALILLLDQFPRNMFRSDPRAFATDLQSQAITQQAIARGLDQELPALQRWFLYIPLMHSENLAYQRQSVELFRQLKDVEPETASAFTYAVRHLKVIERFGRFPHRNQILNRTSTPEEVKFLKQPGSSF